MVRCGRTRTCRHPDSGSGEHESTGGPAAQRVTHRLAAYAAQLCKAGLSVEAVARHLDLDPKTVKAIDKAALKAEFGQTTYDGLKHLAIDEIAVKKGCPQADVVFDLFHSGQVV